jgi:hypothetical protein
MHLAHNRYCHGGMLIPAPLLEHWGAFLALDVPEDADARAFVSRHVACDCAPIKACHLSLTLEDSLVDIYGCATCGQWCLWARPPQRVRVYPWDMTQP